MAGLQSSCRQTLCREAGDEFAPSLNTVPVPQKIDELQARTGCDTK